MISHLLGTFNLFATLLDFEPNLKIEQIEAGKRLFRSLDFSTLTMDNVFEKFEKYTVVSQALFIVYVSTHIINELQSPTLKSTKSVRDFKSKINYIDTHINSFKITLELYKNLQYTDETVDLEEIIELFERIRDKESRGKTLQKFILEYMSYCLNNREAHKGLMASFLEEEQNPIVEKLYKKQDRNVHLYENYFDGLDISIEDIERSMLIKLYYLYAKHSTNRGRGNANPNKRIEAIVLSLFGKRMLITRSKMQSVYIKGFCMGISVFDYRSKAIQEDAIDVYFKTKIEPYLIHLTPQIPALDALIKARRLALINDLILI